LYTIRDIARLAQVSTATVSYVINGKGRVSETLKRRVVDAMGALDYHPDQVARSLKVRKTNVIGVIIPDVTNPFYAEVMRGVEDEARSHGYSVIFCNTNESPELERQYLDTLFARRVDGVIIASDTVNLGEQRHAKQRFPMVFFDRTPPSFAGAGVVTDNLGASQEATQYLINLGHRRIAIIAGWKELSVSMTRLEGFRKALQESAIPLPDAYIKLGDVSKLESGYRNGRDLMMLPTPPTAVFCCNNRIALGLMRALGEMNVDCPKQVSVMAFDDFEWISSFRPFLSTIAQPTHLMGKRATEILVRKMVQEPNPVEPSEDRIVVLPNQLRIRESTTPPYCDSPLPVTLGG
jgi:LacI family transcriptional regulator